MPSSTPYQAIPNSFKASLRQRERLIGCWLSLASPAVTEMLGVIGFDWMLLDAEHAPNDAITLIPQHMALKDSVSAPVVRPQANDPIAIKKLLDGGFVNFLIPFVDSAADATRAVAATRYPPQGIRGVSVGHRGNKFGTVANYFEVANDNIGVAVQIESRAAVEAVDEIAAVEGHCPRLRARARGRQGERHPRAGADRRRALSGDGRIDGRGLRRSRHAAQRRPRREETLLPGVSCEIRATLPLNRH